MAPLSGPYINPLFQTLQFAIGIAVGPLLHPPLQDILNDEWQQHPVVPLDASTAAALAVEGVWTPSRARQEANWTGVDNDRLDALIELIDNPPDVDTLMALWRRGLIDGPKFIEGLRHLRIETDYFDALAATHNVLLTPEQSAAARVKGHMSQAEQYAEALLWGVTNERAQIMYETTGNPPGPETLITMLNRGIIGEGEFAAGIKQGNIRPEYVDEYLGLRHRLLTAHEVVNLRLRGWIQDGEMYSRGAAVGYTQDAMHDLFLGQGRPISFRQVFIGERRGGVYDGPTGEIDPPFLKSLQESNVRPEWYNLAWAQRHSYPSAFVLRALAQSGDLDPPDVRRVLLEIGWPDWLIEKVVTIWTGSTEAGAGPLTKSARTQAITEIRNAYLINQADAGQARAWLTAIGVPASEQAGMLPIWDVMKQVPQRGLTPAQIKKAYRDLPAKYTLDWATARLLELGYTNADIAALLEL